MLFVLIGGPNFAQTMSNVRTHFNTPGKGGEFLDVDFKEGELESVMELVRERSEVTVVLTGGTVSQCARLLLAVQSELHVEVIDLHPTTGIEVIRPAVRGIDLLTTCHQVVERRMLIMARELNKMLVTGGHEEIDDTQDVVVFDCRPVFYHEMKLQEGERVIYDDGVSVVLMIEHGSDAVAEINIFASPKKAGA